MADRLRHERIEAEEKVWINNPLSDRVDKVCHAGATLGRLERHRRNQDLRTLRWSDLLKTEIMDAQGHRRLLSPRFAHFRCIKSNLSSGAEYQHQVSQEGSTDVAMRNSSAHKPRDSFARCFCNLAKEDQLTVQWLR